MAQKWITERLVPVFPELRNHPEALERPYQQLDLEPRPGMHSGEAAFELISPGERSSHLAPTRAFPRPRTHPRGALMAR
jgi:hypothetical protein